MQDSFKTKARLKIGSTNYTIYSLKALEKKFPRVKKLPFSLRILLENLLRYEDGRSVTAQDIEALATRDVKTPNDREIALRPPRRRPPAGFHGSARRRRPRDDARGPRRNGRQPRQDQPARAGRPRDRPLGHRRPVRHVAGFRG